MTVELTGDDLAIEDLVAVARERERVGIAAAALDRVRESRAALEGRIDDGEVMYGVTTGFGASQDQVIPREEIAALQENLMRSHAFGVGDPIPAAAVRGMMLLRLNSLLSGHSGVRPAVVRLLEGMVNAGVHPRVPRKGSVSSSGDLAPLAHVGLVMIGEGRARVDGETTDGGDGDREDRGGSEADGDWLPGDRALAAAGLEPLTLQAKEGLAIVNGTNYVTAVGALAVHDAAVLADTADTTGALSLEAERGIADAFRPEIHELRNHDGQETVARRVREAIEGSDLVRTAGEGGDVQDEYSLRCMPQVHGATREVVDNARATIEREMNAVTDNPLIVDGDVVSGGNFHAQPVALALDSLTAAVAELANIAERRIFALNGGDDPVDADDPGLPLGLVDADTPGLNSGTGVPQITAAALVSENKTLAHPDAADSVPTTDNQEDHVSMGANAANHLRETIDNVTRVLGIEALVARQALSIRDGEPGAGSREALAALAERVDPIERDRAMTGDLAAIVDLVEAGGLR